jgi:hypothetical protein
VKSQTRAWLVFLIIFLAWNTIIAAPFRYFADMLKTWGQFLVQYTHLASGTQALLIFLWIGVLLVIFLLLGRGRSRLYLAGIFSLAEVTYHLIICIRNNQLYDVSLPITVGLALALLFLLINSKSPSLWLSDAFITALAAWLIYEGPLPALFSLLKIPFKALSPLIVLSNDALIFAMKDYWHLPLLVLALIPTILAVVPLLFLASGRQKG